MGFLTNHTQCFISQQPQLLLSKMLYYITISRTISRTGWPGRLWSLLLWRYSRPTWTRSSAACSRWPCFGRGVGLDDPQRSLPTPNILWFCDHFLLQQYLCICTTSLHNASVRWKSAYFAACGLSQGRFFSCTSQISCSHGWLTVQASIHTPVTPALLAGYLYLTFGSWRSREPYTWLPDSTFFSWQAGSAWKPRIPFVTFASENKTNVNTKASFWGTGHYGHLTRISRLLYLGVQGSQVAQEGHLPQEGRGAVQFVLLHPLLLWM